MSATVAAALKKIAVALLTDEKARHKICAFILSVFAAVFMPLAALLALFQGKVEFSAEQLEQIAANIDVEEAAKLATVQDTLDAIEEAMDEADQDERYEEAQVLYLLALYDYSEEDDFVDRLVACFEEDQTDYELIDKVNEEFGTDIDPAEYVMVVSGMRDTTINPFIFTDPSTKNSTDLVAWAEEAYSDGWGYVWGTYGLILTQNSFEYLCEQDPKHVGKYSDFIQESWVGRRTADCVGLIKSYLWYNPETRQIEWGYGGAEDVGANKMYKSATESGPISEMPDIPGLGVWHNGHVGIYVGNGFVIQAMGTKYGVVKTRLEGSNFTNWFKIPGVTYP